MSDVLAVLRQLGVEARTYDHPPVFTVEEARAHWAAIPASHTKNLFLKDEARTFWLVVMPADMPLDLKALPARIASKRLRFASADELMAHLGVAPGAVSPLALVNDPERKVRLVVDKALMAAGELAFHPLDNARTTVLPPAGFTAFLAHTGHAPLIAELGS